MFSLFAAFGLCLAGDPARVSMPTLGQRCVSVSVSAPAAPSQRRIAPVEAVAKRFPSGLAASAVVASSALVVVASIAQPRVITRAVAIRVTRAGSVSVSSS